MYPGRWAEGLAGLGVGIDTSRVTSDALKKPSQSVQEGAVE
jgi:hypothetical protein